jgi:hypothetical protein
MLKDPTGCQNGRRARPANSGPHGDDPEASEKYSRRIRWAALPPRCASGALLARDCSLSFEEIGRCVEASGEARQVARAGGSASVTRRSVGRRADGHVGG